MEGTAGAVPAILEHLRLILQAGTVHPGFQRLFQVRAKAAGGRQAHPLDLIQIHLALLAVHTAQGDIHTGDGLFGDEDGIVHAEGLPGLDAQILILELILTQDNSVHTLALEVDH